MAVNTCTWLNTNMNMIVRSQIRRKGHMLFNLCVWVFVCNKLMLHFSIQLVIADAWNSNTLFFLCMQSSGIEFLLQSDFNFLSNENFALFVYSLQNQGIEGITSEHWHISHIYPFCLYYHYAKVDLTSNQLAADCKDYVICSTQFYQHTSE